MRNGLGILNPFAAFAVGLIWLIYWLLLEGFYLLPFLVVGLPYLRIVRRLTWKELFRHHAEYYRESGFRIGLLLKIPIDLLSTKATFTGKVTNKWEEIVLGWPSIEGDIDAQRFWIDVTFEPFNVSGEIQRFVAPGGEVTVSYYRRSKIVTRIEERC